jgi:hypothetical protein
METLLVPKRFGVGMAGAEEAYHYHPHLLVSKVAVNSHLH